MRLIITIAAVLASAAACKVFLLPDVEAQRAKLVEPATGQVFYEKDLYGEHVRTQQGSVAKVMTIHVALKAVRDGLVSMDDQIPMTLRATMQPCTCIRDADHNGLPDTVPGEIFRFEDLLYFTGLSGGDATDLVAEHVARRVFGYPDISASTINDTAESEARMRDFVSLMNAEVDAIGLQDTFFTTVHGGDLCDFSYCDGQGSSAGVDAIVPWLDVCLRGMHCAGSGTTPSDLIAIWSNAVEADSRFLGITGFRSKPDAVTQYGTYKIKHKFNYYPGVDGDKSGGSPMCQTCLLGQATRFDRTLVGAVTQAENNQHAVAQQEMFAYGFDRLFTPVLMGHQEDLVNVAHQGIDCFGASRVGSATALGTLFDRHLRVEVLDVDASAGTMSSVATYNSPVRDGLGIVDAALVSPEILVTASEETGVVHVESWMISKGRQAFAKPVLARQGEAAFASAGLRDVRVVSMGGDLVAVGALMGKYLHVRLFRVDSAAHLTAGPMTVLSSVESFDLADGGQRIDLVKGNVFRELFIAHQRPGDAEPQIETWSYDASSGGGTLLRRFTLGLVTKGSGEPANGNFFGRQVRVTSPAPGVAIFVASEKDADGLLVAKVESASSGSVPLAIDRMKVFGEASSEIEIASARAGAHMGTVVSVLEADASERRHLAVFEFPEHDDGDPQYLLLASSDAAAATSGTGLGLCRLDASKAVADYVWSASRLGKTRDLSIWRVGEHP